MPRIASPPSRTTSTARWPSWLITAGVLGSGRGPFLRNSKTPSRFPYPPTPVPLALNVTAVGNGLRLSWDHQTSRLAGHAVLWIKDGPDEQRFELDSKQLSEGSVAYWPRNSDVTFRLELLSACRRQRHRIGTIHRRTVEGAADRSDAGGGCRQSVPPHLPSRRSRAVPRAPKRPRGNRIGSASRQLSRTFVLPRPETGSAAVTPAPLPDPPVIQQASCAGAGTQQGISQTHRAGQWPGERGFVHPRPRGACPVHGWSAWAAAFPSSGNATAGRITCPLPHSAIPGSPVRRIASVSREVNIDVKVYVNPAGKVDYSEVLSKVAGTRPRSRRFRPCSPRDAGSSSRPATATAPCRVKSSSTISSVPAPASFAKARCCRPSKGPASRALSPIRDPIVSNGPPRACS